MKLVWLRRDLRAIDNSALVAASQSGEPVAALYVATPETWSRHSLAPIQADLMFRRLSSLSVELEKYNIPLFYAEVDTYRRASDFVVETAKAHGITSIYFNKEYEFNEQRRDHHLEELLESSSIECIGLDDKCIFKPGSVFNKQGAYFKVFTPFKKAYLSKLEQESFVVSKPVSTEGSAKLVGVEKFSPSSQFTYPRKDSQAYSVETEDILRQLREFVSAQANQYNEDRDFPAIEGTSRLSAYLAIGALSVRQCMARLHYQQSSPLSSGREVWQSELIWREFYQHLLHFESKLSKGKSFVAWGDQLHWKNNPQHIEAWKQGQTGYPIVDAAMRQLNQTGWMHNRLRMIVASYLVKDLHVDWRIGEQYFMSALIDGDYAANNGGWQWCASTGCDGQPYFRIFNPITQGEKFDPNGEFVRRWVPELSEVPLKHLHKPWTWLDAKVLSYPTPIVDHKTERAITLDLYKEAKESVERA